MATLLCSGIHRLHTSAYKLLYNHCCHKITSVPFLAAGLSSYLPLRNENPVLTDANKSTPVLLCHGDADQVSQLAGHFGHDHANSNDFGQHGVTRYGQVILMKSCG